MSSVTAAVAILDVVIAKDATIGLCAVPAKSPASCTTPFITDVASTTCAFELLLFAGIIDINESTYVFTALAEGYLVSELPSITSMLVLFAIDSLLLIRFDNDTVSTSSFRLA